MNSFRYFDVLHVNQTLHIVPNGDRVANFARLVQQKLRVRLWPCKIDLNPPVTLCYCSFQVDTSVVVLFVLCLGVQNIFVLMYVFIFLVKLR